MDNNIALSLRCALIVLRVSKKNFHQTAEGWAKSLQAYGSDRKIVGTIVFYSAGYLCQLYYNSIDRCIAKIKHSIISGHTFIKIHKPGVKNEDLSSGVMLLLPLTLELTILSVDFHGSL